MNRWALARDVRWSCRSETSPGGAHSKPHGVYGVKTYCFNRPIAQFIDSSSRATPHHPTCLSINSGSLRGSVLNMLNQHISDNAYYVHLDDIPMQTCRSKHTQHSMLSPSWCDYGLIRSLGIHLPANMKKLREVLSAFQIVDVDPQSRLLG